MTRWLMAAALALALAVGAWAQATPKLYWEHDGLNVTTFKCVVGTTTTDLGIPSKTGTTYSTDLSNCSGVMVNGTHSLVIQACNGTVCAPAVAITVVKL